MGMHKIINIVGHTPLWSLNKLMISAIWRFFFWEELYGDGWIYHTHFVVINYMGLYIYNYFALFIQLLPKKQKKKEKRDVKRSKQSKEKSSQTKRPTERSHSEGQSSVSSWSGNRSGHMAIVSIPTKLPDP